MYSWFTSSDSGLLEEPVLVLVDELACSEIEGGADWILEDGSLHDSGFTPFSVLDERVDKESEDDVALNVGG